jgi:hypothetical protein
MVASVRRLLLMWFAAAAQMAAAAPVDHLVLYKYPGGLPHTNEPSYSPLNSTDVAIAKQCKTEVERGARFKPKLPVDEYEAIPVSQEVRVLAMNINACLQVRDSAVKVIPTVDPVRNSYLK